MTTIRTFGDFERVLRGLGRKAPQKEEAEKTKANFSSFTIFLAASPSLAG